MITLFTGEFLTNPVPLEMRLNQCNYNCHYCYTVAKKKDYFCNIIQISNLLKKAQEDSLKLEHFLLKYHYPVAISNHVDPFCEANENTIKNVVTLLDYYNVPIFWETKGGKSAWDYVDRKPECWYITITSDNSDFIKKYEPNAPSIEERIELAIALKEAGHHVIIGLNPYIPEWWENKEGFLILLKENNIEHLWIQMLHLSSDHISKMSLPSRDILGRDLISKARKSHYINEVIKMEEVVSFALELDMYPYYLSMPDLIDFWFPFKELYGNAVFPTYLDFAFELDDLLEKEGKEEIIVTFDMFKEYVYRWFPANADFRSKDYLGVQNKTLCEQIELAGQRGIDSVLWVLFNYGKFNGSIGSSPYFSYIVNVEDKDATLPLSYNLIKEEITNNCLVLFSRNRLKCVKKYISKDLVTCLK